MEILEQIEKIANKGYSIEYITLDQIAEGHKELVDKGYFPPITYTAYVIRISDGEQLYVGSFDHIIDCFKAGIKYIKENIEGVIVDEA